MPSPIATVIVLAERAPSEVVHQTIANVFNQTYKNLDVIVTYFKRDDNLTEVKDRWATTSFPIRFIETTEGFELLYQPLREANGEIVFYKSVNPVFWLPRHIQHHMDLFKYDNKAEWSYSFLEYRNMDEQNQFLNSLGFRVDTKLNPQQVVIDEIVHLKTITPAWQNCIANINGNNVFFPGLIVNFFKDKRCAIPKEITVNQWQKIQPPQPPQFGFPKSNVNPVEEVVEQDGNLVVKCEFPTILGNSQWLQHNELVRSRFANIPPTDIKKIAVKRTIGMGDVVLAEPAIRALQKKYPNATVDFYVGESRGSTDIAKLFACKPNVISMTGMGEAPLIQDYLYDQKGYDLRFDLDLAYESRKNTRYVDAYLDVLGYKDEVVEKDGQLVVDHPVPEAERVPQLSYTPTERIVAEKYVSVTLEGSGWPGKEWNIQNWKPLLEKIQKAGYKLVFTSNQAKILEENVVLNETNDFDKMLNYLYYADFHIGADNGPMHVAAAFGKPCFILCGAATTKFTTPSPLVYGVSKPDLTCLHCKGRQFFNDNGQGGVTFVARCENQQDPHACMTKLEVPYVESEFDKFRTKFNIA
jgi:ADP-heptose:LPS heptosyltransferase